MSQMVPLYGFGSGSGGTGATLTVTAPAGCTVTVSRDGKRMTKAADASGVAVFKGLATGEWTVTMTDGSQTARKPVFIHTDYSVAISFSSIPDFTYTGDYEIVNDADEPITTSQDNWKIRFLTSGTLIFTHLNGAENGIDVFLVGGGARGSAVSNHSTGVGGGGGYTRTISKISLTTTTQYDISVGGQGGDSSAFGYIAAAGCTGADSYTGGNGGSGGGGYNNKGGADGNNGGSFAGKGVGYGQRNLAGPNGETGTTREFGESDGKLYSKGGDGITGKPSDPIANTGNGGDGSSSVSGAGSSGIIIIRNAREVS